MVNISNSLFSLQDYTSFRIISFLLCHFNLFPIPSLSILLLGVFSFKSNESKRNVSFRSKLSHLFSDISIYSRSLSILLLGAISLTMEVRAFYFQTIVYLFHLLYSESDTLYSYIHKTISFLFHTTYQNTSTDRFYIAQRGIPHF